MGDVICSVDGCTGSRLARGYCGKHYQRLRAGSDPRTPSSKDLTADERFWRKVDKTGPCWIWTAGRDWDGYGIFSDAGRSRRAHRWSYAALVGPIPDGLQLDHLCRNRACVNPGHLEPVESRQNTMRSPVAPAALNAAKDVCRCGQPYDAVSRSGARRCRECEARAARRRRGWGEDAVDAPIALPPADRQACPSGHPYDSMNTYLAPNGNRHCRACHRERERKRYHDQRRTHVPKQG